MSHFPATPTPTPRDLTADEKELAAEAPFLRAALSALREAMETSERLGNRSPREDVRNAFREIATGIGDTIKDSGLQTLSYRASELARETVL